MFREFCAAFVAIYLSTYVFDYYNSIKKDCNIIPKKETNDNLEYRYDKIRIKKDQTENNKDFEVNSYKEEGDLDKMVFVRSLGYATDSDLKESANAISSYFGIPTKILDEITAENFMFLNDSLNGDAVLEHFVNNETKTIYVSRLPLTDNDRQTLAGLTYNKSKAIIIDSNYGIRHITIHEMGHTFGLRHCSDENCIMYYTYSRDMEDFCEKCKSILKSKYPSLN